jgi:hypothetical protein
VKCLTATEGAISKCQLCNKRLRGFTSAAAAFKNLLGQYGYGEDGVKHYYFL